MKTLIEKSDTELKTDVLTELKYEPSVNVADIGVLVSDGIVTLNLTGVKGVTNLITIKPKVAASEIETEIEDAFERNALLDAEAIGVETSGNKVTLGGTVRNYAERDEAQRVAWAAPGVFSVDNQLTVESSWGFDD